MSALSPEQKRAIDQALDFLDRLRACYAALPEDQRKVPSERVEEIRRMTENLRGLNRDGKIDWVKNDFGVRAETDRNGIHLNPDFGGDYRNDYEIPADWHLDNCEEGYFASFWKVLEILFHEKYHYENHSGPLGSLNKVFVTFSYATAGKLLEGLGSLFGGKHQLRRKYSGHEHQAYRYAASLLFWIESVLFWVCFDALQECIPCCRQHEAELKQAKARQEPYDFRR